MDKKNKKKNLRSVFFFTQEKEQWQRTTHFSFRRPVRLYAFYSDVITDKSANNESKHMTGSKIHAKGKRKLLFPTRQQIDLWIANERCFWKVSSSSEKIWRGQKTETLPVRTVVVVLSVAPFLFLSKLEQNPAKEFWTTIWTNFFSSKTSQANSIWCECGVKKKKKRIKKKQKKYA